jgi:hypothetical protein
MISQELGDLMVRCDGVSSGPLHAAIQEMVEAIPDKVGSDQLDLEFFTLAFTPTLAGGGVQDIPFVLQRPRRMIHIVNIVNNGVDNSNLSIFFHPGPLESGIALGAAFVPTGRERWLPFTQTTGQTGIAPVANRGVGIGFRKPVQRFFISAYGVIAAGLTIVTFVASDDTLIGDMA